MPPMKLLVAIAVLAILPRSVTSFFPGGRLIIRGKTFIRNRRPKIRRFKMAPEKEKRSRMGIPSMPHNKQLVESNGLDVIDQVGKKAKPKKPQKKPPLDLLSGLKNAFVGMFPVYKSREQTATTAASSASTPVAQKGVKTSAAAITAMENGVADPATTDAPTTKDSAAKTKPKAKDTAADESPDKDKAQTITESVNIKGKPGDSVSQRSTTTGAPVSSEVEEPPPGRTPKNEDQAKHKPQPKSTPSEPNIPVEKISSGTDTPSVSTSGTQLGDEIIADDVLLESVKIAQQGVDGNIADFDIDTIVLDEISEETVVAQGVSAGGQKVEEKMDPKTVAEATRRAVESYAKATSNDRDKTSPVDSALQSEPVHEENSSLLLLDFSTLTMKQLKLELGNRSLKKSGRKAELIARLEAHENGETTDYSSALTESEDSPYASMKVTELKKELKNRGMKMSGKKAELIARLERADAHDSTFEPVVPQDPAADTPMLDYSSMTVALLKSELKLRGLPQRGRKQTLISRLEENDVAFDGSPSTSDAALLDFELPPLEPDLTDDTGLDGNIEDLAKAARDAALKFQTESLATQESADTAVAFGSSVALVDEEVNEGDLDMLPVLMDSMTDWAKYSIGDLKSELANRGLNTKGSKIELIASLETSDLQAMMDGPAFDQNKDKSPLLDEIDFESYDIEALSNAAKDAVLEFEAADEPTDEALWEIENEMDSEQDFEIPEDILQMATTEVPPIAAPDYESMAVSQLKAELKSRGLRVTGKKIDLVARLQESD